MKRYLAVLLSVLWTVASVLPVSANGGYNDDEFNWGEYACTHSTTKSVAAVSSTCTEPGHGAYTRCVACGLVVAGSDALLPLAEHTYDNACDGDCNVCGAVRGTAHNYRDTEIAPDCENSGYVIHTCAVCGDSYADGRVDALGHSYALVDDVPPSCTVDGQKVYGCIRCGDGYTDTIPATGIHSYDYICDETCNVCGYIRDDAHAYVFMGTVEPTCGEDGSDGYKCMECGQAKYVIIPATGHHTYSGVCDLDCNVCGLVRESVVSHHYVLTDTVDRTCTTDGMQTYTCSGCGDSYTNIDTAPGHKYAIAVTAPDCENGGYTTHTCSVCGYSCVDNHVPALGHTPGAAADCENAQTCTVCGAELKAALGHSWVEADCYTPKTCSTCGATEGAIAHGNIVHVAAGAPTCTEPGNVEYWYCDVCGSAWLDRACTQITNLKSVILPMGDHVYDDDRDADCNVCGFVREVETAVPGDANGDGAVNNRDLALIQQYINKWEISIDLDAGDVNNDGAVNNRDLALMQQYINKWDVELV